MATTIIAVIMVMAMITAVVERGIVVVVHWPLPAVAVHSVAMARYVLMYARDNAATADVGQQPPSGEQIDAAVTALRMLADPTRLRLLWELREGEHDVTTLTAAVGAARPAVSQHLGKLLLAGLVNTRRDGRRVLYRARGGHVRRLVLEALYAADHHLTGAPEHD
jgi:DNA-binding transcriptional ArsR family regulator